MIRLQSLELLAEIWGGGSVSLDLFSGEMCVPGRGVCLPYKKLALGWGRGHSNGHWNRAPQQKSVPEWGAIGGLSLAWNDGWAAQGFGGFWTKKQQPSVRAQKSESPSGPEVPIKVFFPLF